MNTFMQFGLRNYLVFDNHGSLTRTTLNMVKLLVLLSINSKAKYFSYDSINEDLNLSDV